MSEKIKCDLCGFSNENDVEYCKNCNNKLEHKSIKEKLLYQLKVKLINGKNHLYELNRLYSEFKEDIVLVNYLIDKKNGNFVYEYLNESNEDYELIIRDILYSNDYSDSQRNEIIEKLNVDSDKKESYKAIIDGSYYNDKASIDELIKKTINLDINIPNEPPKINRDRNFGAILLFVSIVILFIQLIIGLIAEDGYKGPVMILFSLLPALFFAVSLYKLIGKYNYLYRVLGFLMFIVFFFIISYVMSAISYGFVSISEYFNNLYHSIGNIIDEINKRIIVTGE